MKIWTETEQNNKTQKRKKKKKIQTWVRRSRAKNKQKPKDVAGPRKSPICARLHTRSPNQNLPRGTSFHLHGGSYSYTNIMAQDEMELDSGK